MIACFLVLVQPFCSFAEGTGLFGDGRLTLYANHESKSQSLSCIIETGEGGLIVIDGGFCEAYRNVTGIAGYTLIYSSYGLSLTAHEPFTSAEDAVATERDIVSNRVAVRYNPRRALVGDTDNGKALKERIQELKQLLDAYRKGVIKEKK